MNLLKCLCRQVAALKTQVTELEESGGGTSTTSPPIYNASEWEDLSAFSINTANATVEDGIIKLPDAAVSDFSKSLQLSDYSCINHWKAILVFKPTAAASAGNKGISVGAFSTNTNARCSWAAYFRHATDSNQGKIQFFYQSNNNTWATSTSTPTALTYATNDTIEMFIERINQSVILRLVNLTQITASVYYKIDVGITATPIAPNTAHFAIGSHGGTWDVLEFEVQNREIISPNIMFVGDSKTLGYGASTFYTTYPGLLGYQYDKTTVSAGFGDTTQDLLNHLPEILAIKPRQVILSIGSNDIRFGVNNEVFEANYIDITRQLEGAGIEVIHLSPTYEGANGVDTSGQYDFVKANYPKFIDSFRTIQLTGNLYTDTIHWSTTGDRDVVQDILDSGYLKGAKTSQEYIQ